MQTLEILFTNRRKEKLTADTLSLTEAPGWVVLRTGGAVAEMISASVIKRIRFVTADAAAARETAVPRPEPSVGTPPPVPGHLLKLPLRPAYLPTRPPPVVPSRRFA